jgi:hypothetical protein
MTLNDLKIIYDREHSQVGDTEQDFYEWAIKYLLDKKSEDKEIIIQIKRHLGDIKKELKKLEQE